jgi:hypothetical protein
MKNLKDLLSENMHRFGTKNLNEDGDQNNNGYPDNSETAGGRSVSQIQKEWIRVTTEIAKLAAQYQGPQPELQNALNLGSQLKAKARIKQKLEKELIDVIAGDHRDTYLRLTQLI